jgi:hypothetical protein
MHAPDRGLGDAVLGGEFGLTDPRPRGTDIVHRLLGQLGVGAVNASSRRTESPDTQRGLSDRVLTVVAELAAFARIAGVVPLRPGVQVRGIDARLVVAGVQSEQPIGQRAVVDDPRGSRGMDRVLPIKGEAPVASGSAMAGPRPTGIRATRPVDLRPEADFGCRPLSEVMAARHLLDVSQARDAKAVLNGGDPVAVLTGDAETSQVRLPDLATLEVNGFGRDVVRPRPRPVLVDDRFAADIAEHGVLSAAQTARTSNPTRRATRQRPAALAGKSRPTLGAAFHFHTRSVTAVSRVAA